MPTPVLESPLPLAGLDDSAAPDRHIGWRASAPFLAFHLVPLAAIWTGVQAADIALAAALYLTRMFFITAGYHRYFSHRSYRLGRVAQFVMAFGGLTAAQKGPLWWASTHRAHHRFADTDRDPHSPTHGFWWSHAGWILTGRSNEGTRAPIGDFSRYPELRFLDRNDWLGPWTAGVICFLIGGWSGLVIGFFASTVLLWHATFCVNSVAHVFGRRRYDTPDMSRNNAVLALMTFGEGWHNNHHYRPSSARQGDRWWQLDVSYAVLRALALVGIVRGLRTPRRS